MTQVVAKISCPDEPSVDVFFIHGLFGDPAGTWTGGSGKEFWPKWLEADFPNFAFYTIGFPASLFVQFAKKEMDIFERANSILDYLTSYGFGSRPTVFITHSLGGILAKVLLDKSKSSSDPDQQALAENTKLLIFLGTPHTGASLAAVVKTIIGSLTSPSVELLANGLGVLSEINSRFRKMANNNGALKCVAYYEKHKTKGIMVVSRESADPGVSNCDPVAVERNHIDLVKMDDDNDQVFLGIKRHLQSVLSSSKETGGENGSAFPQQSLNVQHDLDRRSLLDKLVDAKMEHHYSSANAEQNRFARQYSRLGLYSSAKTKNDQLLSQVKQRFDTHVYSQHICQGSTHEKILDALQNRVIDPLVGKWRDEDCTPNTVIGALYFLTELCHIRWDAEK